MSLPRPPEIDEQHWRTHVTERETQCRDSAEKEKRVYKSLLQRDEMHDAYEKLLKDAESRLVKIYEEDEGGNGNDGVAGQDEGGEHVKGMLQEAREKNVERVDLSGQRLKALPEAFCQISSLVVLNLSTNQLVVIVLTFSALHFSVFLFMAKFNLCFKYNEFD